MPNELAATILLIAYCATVVPFIGRLMVIGRTTKAHWAGYGYEECLERGFYFHLSIFAIAAVAWAIVVIEI